MSGQYLSRWPAFARNHYWLALFSGALLPLAFAPFNFFPVAFISPAILFALFLTERVNNNSLRALKIGFVFGLGLFGVGVSWVFVSMVVNEQTSITLPTLMTLFYCSFWSISWICNW